MHILVMFGSSTLLSFALLLFVFHRRVMAAVTVSVICGLLVTSYFLSNSMLIDEGMTDYKSDAVSSGGGGRAPSQAERMGLYSLTGYF